MPVVPWDILKSTSTALSTHILSRVPREQPGPTREDHLPQLSPRVHPHQPRDIRTVAGLHCERFDRDQPRQVRRRVQGLQESQHKRGGLLLRLPADALRQLHDGSPIHELFRGPSFTWIDVWERRRHKERIHTDQRGRSRGVLFPSQEWVAQVLLPHLQRSRVQGVHFEWPSVQYARRRAPKRHR